MHALTDQGAVESLAARLGKLHPERPRAWGRMTPNEMLCHVADAFELALGTRPFVAIDTWWSRTVLRRVALHTNMTWPRGLETSPEVAQGIGGSAPGGFADERARVGELLRRFATTDRPSATHPVFGQLTRDEWMIWAYRHVDHHLRQFAL